MSQGGGGLKSAKKVSCIIWMTPLSNDFISFMIIRILWNFNYQVEFSTRSGIEEVDGVFEEEGHRDVQQLGTHQQPEGDEDSFLYHGVVWRW